MRSPYWAALRKKECLAALGHVRNSLNFIACCNSVTFSDRVIRVIKIMTCYHDGSLLWSMLPPLWSFIPLIFSSNFSAHSLSLKKVFRIRTSRICVWFCEVFLKTQQTEVKLDNICQFLTNSGLRAFWQSTSGFPWGQLRAWITLECCLTGYHHQQHHRHFNCCKFNEWSKIQIAKELIMFKLEWFLELHVWATTVKVAPELEWVEINLSTIGLQQRCPFFSKVFNWTVLRWNTWKKFLQDDFSQTIKFSFVRLGRVANISTWSAAFGGFQTIWSKTRVGPTKNLPYKTYCFP